MESAALAGLALHPVALAALAVVLVVSTIVLYSSSGVPPPLSKSRLFFGYLGVVVGCLGIAAVSGYVSPEEALARWGVPPEQYWQVLLAGVATMSVLLVYVALMCVAIIGAPAIFALARCGQGNAPAVLVISIAISLVGALALVQFSQSSSTSFVRDAPYLVGTHLVLALGFCVGAKLPWKLGRRAPQT